jgi:hypothetical protein
MNQKLCIRKQLWHIFSYHPVVFMEELENEIPVRMAALGVEM